MDSKIKSLLVVLVAIIILAGVWLFQNIKIGTANCSEVNSMSNIENCIGNNIQATGMLKCDKPNVDRKAGVHFLKFEDATELRFLEEYTNCKDFNGENVTVVGKLYQCGMNEQCAGIGLVNIESVFLPK